VTGALWAAASGIGFGLFQSLNRRAVRDIDDPYVSTFLQLLIASLILVVPSLATEDLGELGEATTWSLVAFALAGIVHFLLGWTFLNISQDRIGAARTSPLLTMTPVFGLFVALVTVGEQPAAVAIAGMAVSVVGAWIVSRGDQELRIGPVDAAFGLLTACMWAISPILTLEGLDSLESPLLGVTLGMLASTAAYGVLLLLWRKPVRVGEISADALAFKLVAAALVALATWGRWLALDFTEVAVVLTLNMLAVPVVLIVAPLVSGRHLERVTAKVWLGSLLVVTGSLVLILEA
jgi:drug/metabolite transporter (DMT)-like permease